MPRQAILERGELPGRRGGPDRPGDRHRVRLQVDVLDRLAWRRLGARLRANAGQAVEREQGVVDRPEQRHRVERLDPLHAGDAVGRDRRGQLATPGPCPAGVSSSGSS